MNAISSPSNRLVVAAGTVAVLMIVIMAIILPLPARTLAQAGEPGPSPTGPPSPPPPLNPPIRTPEPDQPIVIPSASQAGPDVEVVRFRSKMQIQKGQPSVLAQGGEKPAGAGAAGAEKPPSKGVLGPQEAYTPPDYGALLTAQDWNFLLYEDFEGVFPSGLWAVYDFGPDGFDRTWGTDDYNPQLGTKSAWPAAGGTDGLDPSLYYYTDNLYSWMEYGPFDFSNMADIFVGFGLWYDTEPSYDWLYFCASTDGQNYHCNDYWAGNSGGWTDQAYWLTSYAGYSQVWLAWIFESDGSISSGYDGPFVDEVAVWGYDISAPPTPTPTPDPNGQLVQNPSFETGDLTNWNSLSSSSVNTLEDKGGLRPSLRTSDGQKSGSGGVSPMDDGVHSAEVNVTDLTAVEGQYSAYLWRSGDGDDFLYQTINVPAGVANVTLNFWFGVTTDETAPDNDWFCVSMSDPTDHSNILVDLGCMDAYYTTGYWQEVLYTLSSSEVAAIAGRPVDFVFELYNRGGQGSGTAGWVDYVRVYATGGGGGNSLDPNEPNDDTTSATLITCGQTISGTIGDALGGYDIDWFTLSSVPTGQLDIDIDADTRLPPSALDSVVYLYDSGVNMVAWNDDDGVSYDSYITYTNAITDTTFYMSLESYSGYGSPDSFYDLTVQCAGAGHGPPPGGAYNTLPLTDTWTVMLYLNAEDRNFAPIVRKYVTDIEAYIGSKSSFLNVLVLYDGPSDGDTVRYYIQPNGNYTDGVNRWDMGELNMGDSDTLANFARWAMDLYPAEKYYLAVDDHGHGVYGISWDKTDNNDHLTPPELYSALKDITYEGQRKIDIFDYEACLMGTAEIAYDVREWVDYVVFSEQISWALNTYPVYFSDLAAADTPLQVGQRIISRYHSQADNAERPHTISLIDTAQMTDGKQAVTNLGNALSVNGTGDASRQTAVTAARNNSQAFAADNDATNPILADYIDLWDLADKTASLSGVGAAAAQVKTVVENAVVTEQHSSGQVGDYYWDHSRAHGLSIYYPPTNGSSVFNDYIAPRIFQMSEDESGINGRWDEFLAWAVTTGGNGPSNGLGGGDRKGMNGARFLQPKGGGSSFIYLPIILRNRRS